MVGDEWRDIDSLRLMSLGISVVFVVSAFSMIVFHPQYVNCSVFSVFFFNGMKI